MLRSMLNYKYYDTPEGQDIFLKTLVTSKYALMTALPAATIDVLMFSRPQGVIKTAGRYMWWCGPLVGMAAAFTVTANIAQGMRGKNDKINYFLGGVASGAVFGAWSRSMVAAVPVALALGMAGVIKKTGIEEGWQFVREVPHATKTIRSVRHDWSLVEDIEELKNFTTNPK